MTKYKICITRKDTGETRILANYLDIFGDRMRWEPGKDEYDIILYTENELPEARRKVREILTHGVGDSKYRIDVDNIKCVELVSVEIPDPPTTWDKIKAWWLCHW